MTIFNRNRNYLSIGGEFYSRWNKSGFWRINSYNMILFLTRTAGLPIFPPFRPPRGALLREAFEGWGGMRYPCAWLSTLTPGHVQRAASCARSPGNTRAAHG